MASSLATTPLPTFIHEEIQSELVEDQRLSSTLPPTINELDPRVLRARRSSDRKAARVLDITIAREDVDMAYCPDATDDPISAAHSIYGRRRSSLSHLNLGSLSLRDVALDEDMEEETPLVGGKATKVARRTKARKRLDALLSPLKLKPRTVKVPQPMAYRATLGALVPSRPAHQPLTIEDAMDWQADAGISTSPTPTAEASGSTSPEHASGTDPFAGFSWTIPTTPRRGHAGSAPTTPRVSPYSAKSKESRGSRHTPRTPHTPHSTRSARSWLSEPSPGSVAGSSGGSLSSHDRRMRARARLMASQMKSLQILGTEAGEAIARATGVKESKIRYREFATRLGKRKKY
ncbi:hypothetical protein C8Q79DRAFT_1014035 [Trametes meyenii]|nr:hypothetical protein C8Q79DRAFT_1014035 [Trametes meyenii]